MGIIVSGVVVRGSQIGRTIGFPTANIAMDEAVDVANGVYKARVTVGGQTFDGVANVGFKPTVSDQTSRVLEVNIFDFDAQIYGDRIEVELLDFIRPERKFESIEELKEQIIIDKKGLLVR